MTTKDLGGGWTLIDTDQYGPTTPKLVLSRRDDGISEVSVLGDGLDVDVCLTDSGWYGSRNEKTVTIPIDALAELLRSAGWEVVRK